MRRRGGEGEEGGQKGRGGGTGGEGRGREGEEVCFSWKAVTRDYPPSMCFWHSSWRNWKKVVDSGSTLQQARE